MKRLELGVPPRWLPAVSARMEGNLSKDEPPLASTPLDAEPYRDAVAAVLDPGALSVSSPRLQKDATSVGVQGKASLFGSSPIDVTLGFRGLDGTCYFELDASPAGWAPLAPLEKLGLPLGALRLHWRFGPLATSAAADPVVASSHLHFTADGKLGGLALPVAIVPPEKPDPDKLWRVSGRFDAIGLKDLKPLLQWIGGRAKVAELPGLDRLGAIALTGLDLTFDPETPRLVAGVLAVRSTSPPWPLVEKQIVLNAVGLSLGFSVDEDAVYHARMEASAMLKMGDVDVSVGFFRDGGSGSAMLELRSDDATLPGLGELAKLAGVPKLADALPPPVRSLTGLSIEELRLVLDGGNVSSVRIGLACPDDIPIAPKVALENARLALQIAPRAVTKVTGSMTGLVGLSGHYLGLQGELGDGLELEGTVDALPLSALASRLFDLPKELPEVDLKNVAASLSSDGKLHFDASVVADFSLLAEALNIPVPNGMAQMHLSTFALDISPGDGTWSVTLATDESFPFPRGAEHQLQVSGLRLRFGTGASKKLEVSAELRFTGSVTVGRDVSVTLTGAGLHATLQSSGEWKLEGSATVRAFGNDYPNWNATLHQRTFRLSHDGPIPVFKESFAAAIIERFEVGVTDQTASGTEPAKWGFDITGDGSIRITDVVDATGHLELDTTTGRLVLSAGEQTLPTLRLVPPVTLDIDLDRLALTREKTWSFGSAATVRLDGVPESLQQYLPPVRRGRLDIGDEGVTLSCSIEDWHMDFGSLSMRIAGKTIPLGEPVITPLAFDVELGKKPAVSAHLRVAIPRELNRLLGWDAKLEPTTIFLNPSMDLGLSVAKKGFTLALENGTSPLKALKLDDEGFVRWELGEVGTFQFQMPPLTFEGDSWKASFGMKHGPLKFPLRPIKFLMKHLGFPGTKLVPDTLPIPSDIDVTRLGKELPKLLGEAWSHVKAEPALEHILQKLLDAIGRIAGDVEKKLPADFVEYLTLHVPDTIYLDIDTKGPAFTLRTDDNKPLKFLLPWFAAMPPGLAGFALRSVSFGQIAGTLGLVTVDGHLDYFDVVTLTVSAFPGVQAGAFRNRLTAQRTVAVIPSAFPFPIPLFYDDLRWDVQSWTGLGLTTDWKMKAKWSLFDTSVALIDFFTKEDYLLSRDAKEAFDIQFQIGPNFLGLPSFVGGGEVGRNEDVTPALPAGDSLKRLLDSIKTGNLTYLIGAIPLHDKSGKHWYRLGRKKDELEFGPLTFGAGFGWCIATQQELNEDILPNPDARAVLGDLNREDVLDSLPTKAGEPSYQKGFVVMLMGQAGVAPVIEAEGYFGMALTAARRYDPQNEGGFECGFVMQGKIAALLSLRLHGDIHVARDRSTTVQGDCSLKLADLELIGGKAHIRVGNKSFDLGVTLRLAGDRCRLGGGFHIDPVKTVISGRFEWAYATGESFSREGVHAVFSKYGIALKLEVVPFFGMSASFTFYVDGREQGVIGARASFDVSAVSRYVLGEYSQVADDIAEKVKSLESHYEKLLDKYQGHMSLAKGLAKLLRDLGSKLPGIVDAEVKKAAPKIARKIARDKARKKSKAIVKRLNHLADKLDAADGQHAKGLIVGLINGLLAARIDIEVFGKKVYDKSIWVLPPAKKFKGQLEDARDFVEKIRPEKLAAADAKAVWDQARGKHDFAQKIADAVKGGSGAIPQIEEIRWETTELVGLSPASKVIVLATYASKKKTLASVPFRFDHPARSALGVARAIVNAFAKPPKARRRSAGQGKR